MKKMIFGLFIGLFGFSALAEVAVNDVIARQQWPWKRQVRLDFVVSGYESGTAYEILLRAYDGNRLLGDVPLAALSGDVVPARNGKHTLEIDPLLIPGLETEQVVNNFRVELALAEVAAADVLYRIYDLTKEPGENGQLSYVTENTLTNGVWGSWRRDAVPGAASSVVWTEVTNDIKYATTHLVLRRIPAGTMKVGSPQRDFAVTTPFYLAVFETTQRQFELMGGNRAIAFFKLESDFRPIERMSYQLLRGATLGAEWPESAAVDNGSIISNLRTMTGDGSFDLPTEWQWEYACRAGTTTSFNNNTSDQNGMFLVGRCKENGGHYYDGASYAVISNCGITNGTMRVGGYAPNAWGLYDMHGNVAEVCRDWYVADASSFVSDNQNATAAQSNGKRVLRNAGWWDGWSQPSEKRTEQGVTSDGSSNGFRVMVAE